ncbi:protein of unknown function [Ralstonia solanacearum CMR15]|nr:protein of unknown function [Ralstonia solanacearum CMR15]
MVYGRPDCDRLSPAGSKGGWVAGCMVGVDPLMASHIQTGSRSFRIGSASMAQRDGFSSERHS